MKEWSPISNIQALENYSPFISGTILVALLMAGHFTINGFTSSFSLRSMLLLAAFLGVACIGQTLVALLGGLDLSIPYVIGAANILTLWLIGRGLSSMTAILIVLLMGILVGAINGLASLRLQGQALVITLAVGFAVVGATQIRTSIGSQFGGNVYGRVPLWLINMSAPNGKTFGWAIPPIVLVWAILSIIALIIMRRTRIGRAIYMVGGNRKAAKLALVSEAIVWIGAYMVSGMTSALTGIALLGFTGGGFVGVGEAYLFTSVAAVVVGGTSLLGGKGGYGHTILGVLVLTVLSAVLVGYGFSTAAQQVVLGLLIIPMVALYARTPHPRTTV